MLDLRPVVKQDPVLVPDPLDFHMPVARRNQGQAVMYDVPILRFTHFHRASLVQPGGEGR